MSTLLIWFHKIQFVIHTSIVQIMCTRAVYTPSPMASVGGVKVSMVAFQAVDPGSIPGRRIFYIFVYW